MDDEFLVFLLILALVALVGVPILAIAALVKASRMQRRVDLLETRLDEVLRRLPSGAGFEPAKPSVPMAAPVWQDPEAKRPSQLPVAEASEAAQPDAIGLAAAQNRDDQDSLAVQATRTSSIPSVPRLPPPKLGPSPLEKAVQWVATNWVYVISALSLALAGVFFVQYGIENGLLPPAMRVLAGLVFGGGLVAAGEWLRRRYGSDDEAASTIYLPSVFSGAGLVAIFAAITAGRLMYDLYGPGLTFAGLFVTALGAVVLGWRNGPFLAAVGLVGAAAAPFLVGGGEGPQAWLYAYYLLVMAIGLTVDAWRQWGWVSVLALVLGQLGLFAMREGGAGREAWVLAQIVFVLLAVILPGRSLTPRHAGPPLYLAFMGKGPWPAMPVRLAAGAVLAAAAQVLVMPSFGLMQGLMPYLALTILTLVLLWWASEAEGLNELAGITAAAFLLRLAFDPTLIWEWSALTPENLPPESAMPLWVSYLMGMAVAISAVAAWRGLRSGSLPHSLAAVVVGPAAAVILEAFWQPAAVIGAYPWALHAIALAAGMVWLATAFAKRDGGPGRRFAWGVLAALSLIALSFFILTTAAALTLALAVLLVVAVLLDRRFDLLEMSWFVQLGAAVLSYRLVVDPGIFWAETASLAGVLLAYLAVAVACAVARYLSRPERDLMRAVLESLGVASVAFLLNILLLRNLGGAPDAQGNWSPDYLASHWGATLNALPWLVVLGVQLWRAPVSGRFGKWLRFGLGGLAAVLALGGLLLATTVFNPLLWYGREGLILGPPILDSLALAYAVPGLMLLGYVWKGRPLPPLAKRFMAGVGAALLVLYAVTEIRRLWHGRDIASDGVLQGELYSYTLAMLVTGAVLLWQALARRSVNLRRIAMAVIGLTALKVFLWDVSGLSGLVRVLSFAGLGLSLAGLAWLNRWAGQSMTEGEPPQT